MDCPVCHKHRLRNKNKHGIQYRHCIGCGWEKAVKEKPTVMDEVKVLMTSPPVAKVPLTQEEVTSVVSVVDAKETLKVVDEKIVINSPIYSPSPTSPTTKKGFLKKLFGK